MAAAAPAATELAPLLRRVVALEPDALLRLRIGAESISGLVRLPFGVLVGRSLLHAPADGPGGQNGTEDRSGTGGTNGHSGTDTTVGAAEALAWLDGSGGLPRPRDAEWRGGAPPAVGWRRVETVPDTTVRPLVRSGALALRDAPDPVAAGPSLLDSVVIVAADEVEPARPVEVTLRVLSAITRMGFLPRGSYVAIDVAGGWVRVAAEYGSGYLERSRAGLTVLR